MDGVPAPAPLRKRGAEASDAKGVLPSKPAKAMTPKEYSPASLKAMMPKEYSTVAGAGAYVENGMDVHAMTKMRWRDPGFQKSK